MTTHAPAVVLFPGAGSDRHHPALVAIEQTIAPRPTVRADFPYRRAGRRAPDRAPVLVQAVVDEVAALGGVVPPVLGGRSMGGRICSLAVAERRVAAAGLVLVSYPLHPPRRPERLRIEHFPAIDVPCLFVHGTRDPFGAPDELLAHTAAIAGRVTHVWVEGGAHDLRGADTDVAAAVRTWLDATFTATGRRRRRG